MNSLEFCRHDRPQGGYPAVTHSPDSSPHIVDRKSSGKNCIAVESSVHENSEAIHVVLGGIRGVSIREGDGLLGDFYLSFVVGIQISLCPVAIAPFSVQGTKLKIAVS